MRTKHLLAIRIRRAIACLILLPAWLFLGGCTRLEMGIEGTPTPDVATQATVAALAAENARQATQVAALQEAMKTLSPATGSSPADATPAPTEAAPESPSPTPSPPEPTGAPTSVADVSAVPATATPFPPTAVPPTAIPPTPQPLAVRVSFEPGQTSATVEGAVAAQGVDLYVLRAAAGQLMDVGVAAPAGSVSLAIYGADGTVLTSTSTGPLNYRGLLPKGQDYFIQIAASGPAASYTMNVIIPQRIEFQPGSTSANVERDVRPAGTDYYVLRASAGQLVEITVFSAASDTLLVMYGIDGTVLKSGMAEGPGYRGAVPITQDYIIHVTSHVDIGYRLNVTIPERISFAPGSTSATREGELDGYGSHHYVLHATAGQTMSVNLSSHGDSVRVSIYGADGVVLKSGMGEDPNFVGSLPITQDYLIHLSASAWAVRYTLAVDIPAAIPFATDSASSTAQQDAAGEARVASGVSYHAERAVSISMESSRDRVLVIK